MDTQLMLRAGVVLLLVTGLGGVLAAGFHFSGRPHPSSVIAMLHGLLAAGLTLTPYVAFVQGSRSGGWLGLVLLAAVLGGLVLNLAYHWKGFELPVWLVLVHAVAVAARLRLLGLSVWNQTPA